MEKKSLGETKVGTHPGPEDLRVGFPVTVEIRFRSWTVRRGRTGKGYPSDRNVKTEKGVP